MKIRSLFVFVFLFILVSFTQGQVVITPTNDTICSGDIDTLVATGATTYLWSTGSTNDSIFVTPTVTTTYTVQGDGNPANNASAEVVVGPIATATPSAETICSGQNTSITLSSNVNSTTYSWTVSSTNLTGTSDDVGSVITQTLTSTPTNATGSASYTITPVRGSCTGADIVVDITVFPKPKLTVSPSSETICSGNTTATSLSSNVAGATFNWSIIESNTSGASSGSNVPAPTVIAQTLTSVLGGTTTYGIVPTANGCLGNQTDVDVTVDRLPIITNTPLTQTICSGTSSVRDSLETDITSTFSWTVTPTPANITGYTSSGATAIIPAQALTNSSFTLDSVEYFITLNGCAPLGTNYIIYVKPTPVLSSTLTPAGICSGNTFTYTPTSGVAATTFSWTRATIAGITEAGTTGTAGVSETLTNTTTDPIDVTYVYVSTADGCINSGENVIVTVNPIPSLSSSLTPPDICSGNTFNYTPTSATAGATFSWTRATVVGITEAGTTGTGDPNETLTNSTISPITVTYSYTVTANACSGSSEDVDVIVNPTPSLSSTLSPTDICSEATFNYTPTSATAGATYAWSRATIVGITEVGTTGTASVSEALTNTTALPINVTYTYTTTANSCPNSSEDVVVTVNPKPTLSSSLTPPGICSGSSFDYTATSDTPGATFAWSRATIVGITEAGTTGTNGISETLTNSTSNPITVTYTYTLTATGCPNTPEDVDVVVSPIPNLSSTLSPADICSGTTFAYTPTSATTGASFPWSRATIVGITEAGTTGVDDPNETLTNSTGSTISVTYIYTTTINGCSNAGENVVVDVLVVPTLSSTLTPPDICSGNTFAYTPTSTTGGVTFSWSRATVVDITEAGTTGTNGISETLTNTSTAPITVTYVYTTSDGTCNTVENVDVIVNPIPTLSSTLTPPDICSEATFTYTPTSATAGATFPWSRATIAGITEAGTSGTGDPNETLTNSTTAPITVTYTYTTTANGCANSPENVDVVVNPTPDLSSTLTPADICSGVTFTYTPTSATVGSTFSWTRATIVGITETGTTGTNGISETLTNSTTAPITVTYVYTTTANSCPNSGENVDVIVNPIPILSSTLTPTDICSGSTFNYTATSATGSATFAWIRATIVGITEAGTSGTGNVSETLTNTTGATIPVTYVYTTSANGCTNGGENAVINILPDDDASFSYASSTHCKTDPDPIPTVTLPGGIFTASPAMVFVSTSTGEVDISATTIGTYTITHTTAGSCPNASTFLFTLTSGPDPNFSYAAASYCTSVTDPLPTHPPGASAGTFSATAGGLTFVNTATGEIDLSASSAGTYTVTNTILCGGIPVDSTQTITIIESPRLSSTLTPPAECSGSIFAYIASNTSPNGGTVTKNWTRAVQPGIDEAANSGSDNIIEVLTNTTALPIDVTYVYTTTDGTTCSSVENVVVTINPIPVLSSSLTPPDICNGDMINYTPTSNTPGATFFWQRAAITGIGAARNGTDDPNETLNNSTDNPIAVTYKYTTSANGCSSNPIDSVNIVINPIPELSSTLTPPDICSGSTFNYSPSSVTTDSSFTWSRATIAGITEAGTTGSGDPNETLTNTTGSTIPVTYVYTATANGCSNPGENVIVNVKSTPVLSSSLTPPDICSGNTFNYTPTNIFGSPSFSWTRATQAGIVETGTTGTGSVSETLTNTTTNPITVTYVYVTTANGCTNGGENVDVIVNPIPNLNSTLSPSDMCSGTTFNYTPTSATAGATFAWNRATVVGITEAGTTGTGDPNETLTNTTLSPISVTYIYTTTANGCSNGGENLVINVNPTPSLNSTLNPSDICSGNTFNYTVSSITAGATFSWTRVTIVGITQAGTAGTGNVSEVLTNSTTATIPVTYVYSASANGCSNPGENVIINVNPTPNLNSTLTPADICSGNIFSYTPTSATAGATFSWSRTTVVGITEIGTSGTGNPNETLTNTTGSVIPVTYVYTTTANTCPNSGENVTVNVNPTDDPSFSYTSGTYCTADADPTPTVTLGGGTFTAFPAITFISTATGEVDLDATGTGTYTVTYTTAGLCPDSDNFILTINNSPDPDFSYTSSTFCSSDADPLPIHPLGASAGTFNAIPAGLSFINTATGEIDLSLSTPGTYTVTNSILCGGIPVDSSQTVTINESPSLSSTLSPSALCSGSTFSYSPTSTTGGATFSWSRATMAGITEPGTTGTNNPNEVLTNSTSSPINVTYAYTTSNVTCNTIENVIVTVQPTPNLSSTLTPPDICSGSTFGYTPSSIVSGTTFSWTRSTIVGITEAGTTGTASVSETLTNTTTAIIPVTYVYTSTANSCSNSGENVVVNIHPTPILSSALTPSAICSGSTFNYTATSATAGASFTWSRATIVGISEAGVSGSSNVSEILTNTTTSPITVTYIYTTIAGGCPNGGENVDIIVNPTPQLNSTLTPADICSGNTFAYTPTSATGSATFSWNRATIVGITEAGTTGTGNPNETLTNSTGSTIPVTYVYTTTANGCSNSGENVIVNVLPTDDPSFSYGSGTYCTTDPDPTPTATLGGGTYTATPAMTINSSTGEIDLDITGAGTYTVTYSTAGTCSGSNAFVITITNTADPSFSYASANYCTTDTDPLPIFALGASAGVFTTTAGGLVFVSTSTGEIDLSTSTPGTYTVTNTITCGGIPANSNATITIDPTPSLSSNLTPAAICGGNTFNYTPTSSTGGVTFSWSRATIAGITETGTTGTDDPNEILTNTTTSPINVTYIYTTSDGTCSSNENVLVIVKPMPVLSSTLTPSDICNGSTFNYTATSIIGGTTFSWSRATIVGITETGTTGTGNVSEVLSNTTATVIPVTYVYTSAVNGCTNSGENVIVNVNPTPQLNSTLTPADICSGSTFTYSPTSATPGASFSWSRATIAGITESGATGSGNPSEILTNTTTAPITVTYLYTTSANGCSNAGENVVVDVNPTPQLSSSLTPPDICSGSTFNYTPSSATAGATFTWSRPTIAGIAEPANSGPGDPNETLTNNTSIPITVTYSYVTLANGCANSGENVNVIVNPIPVLSSPLMPTPICSGDIFNYTATSATPGATFSWSRATVAGILEAGTTGTGDPNETITNTTSSTFLVTYSYITTANGCANTGEDVDLIVYAIPVLNSSLTPPDICSGSTFTYSPTSTTAGTTFAWNRATIVGITEAGTTGTGDPNETLTNATGSSIPVTYTYTSSANGCSNGGENVIVNVEPIDDPTFSYSFGTYCSADADPTPTVSGTIGGTFTASPAMTINSSTGEVDLDVTGNGTYTVTYTTGGICPNTSDFVINIVAIADPNFSYSASSYCSTDTNPLPTHPVGASPGIFTASPVGIVFISNTTGEIDLIGSTAGTYTVTNTIACSGSPVDSSQTVSIYVTPILSSSLTPPNICSGDIFNYTPTSDTVSATFAWNRATVVGITEAGTTGTGDPNETLTNTTTAPITVTYVYITSANACSSAGQNVDIIINPIPVLNSSSTPPDICSGNTFNYSPTSATAGATFAWNRGTVVGITEAGTTGAGDPNETLTNTTTAPITVTYVYTTSANSCSNAGQNVDVIVNPIPALASTLTPPDICSGNTFNYSPTSATAGATFAWNRATVVGITETGTTGTGDPNETLTNTTTAPITVTYVYTTSANGCPNAGQNVDVIVNPIPALASTLTPPDICSGNTFNYSPTSATAGATFAWNRATVVGITETGTTGTGDPNETLTNTTTAPITVTYVYTTSANGCPNAGQNVDVIVNPIPALASTLTPPDICSGNTFNYSPTSATAGATFAWNRATVVGITETGTTGTGDPNETLTNTTTAPITVTYVYTTSANGCPNAGQNVDVVVNPIPDLASTLTPPDICSGNTFNYSPTSATAGATFAWNRATVVGITEAGTTGTGDPNETLTNTTTAPITVTYVYITSANACSSAGQNVDVIVNPIPSLASTLTPADICSGNTFNYSPTSGTAGATFAWNRATVIGITEAGTTGAGDPNETLTNSTTAPITVTYVYTTSASSCSNAGQNVDVIVNPIPALASSLTPPDICSGNTFNYTPTSTTAGATFSWNRATIVGITETGTTGAGDPNESLTNTTMTPITVTYVYTTSANGCSNTGQNVNVIVNPIPTLSSSLNPAAICSGTTFNYTATSGTIGATYTWSRSTIAGITETGTTGTGNVGEVLTNSTTSPIAVTYVYTTSANSCTNSSENVVLTVVPIEDASFSYSSGTFCQADADPTPAVTGVTGGTFTATGGLTINSSTGEVDLSASPISTYTITYTTPGVCSNSSDIVFTITSTPDPSFTYAAASYCQSDVDPVPTHPLGASAGAFSSTPIGLNFISSSTGEIDLSTSDAGTYTITNTIMCGGVPIPTTQTVSILLTPSLSTTLNPSDICSGDVFNYNPASTPIGATFSWSRASIVGIAEAGSTGTGLVSETLTNTTAAPINVIYAYTSSNAACSVTENVTVTVNPTPLLSSTLLPPPMCSGSTFNYTPTSPTTGASFIWSRATIAGISPSGAANVGPVSEILTNTTAAPINVIYAYTTNANGCSNIENVTLTINPTPVLNTTLTPSDICSGDLFSYSSNSATTGATFSWTRATIAGITEVGNTGTTTINEVLTNTTTATIPVTYVYTTTANSCTNSGENVIINVHPTPQLNTTLTPLDICSGNLFNYNPNSATTGSTYNWSRATVVGITEIGTTGINNVSEILTNSTTSPVNVIYDYTTTANGCSNTPESVTVTVNPIDDPSFTYSTGTYCQSDTDPSATISGLPGGTFSSSPVIPSLNSTTGLIDLSATTVGTYSITYTTSGLCPNTQDFVITITNTPDATFSYVSSNYCSGDTDPLPTHPIGASAGLFTSTPVGLTFVNNSTGEIDLSASGANTYTITNTINCAGSPVTHTVSISIASTPLLTSSTTPPDVCSGTAFTYTATSTSGTATYSWSRATVVGITPTGNTGIVNTINETLTNTSNNPVLVTYIYSLTDGGCSSIENVRVIINPTPSLNSGLTPSPICNGNNFTYNANSATGGASFSWSRATIGGITPSGTSGTGNVNETLTNSTTAIIPVTYVYAASANGCTNSGENVIVNVNPTPQLNSTLTPADICSGSTLSYSATSLTAGASFSWSRASVGGIVEAGTTGSGSISETLTNSTTSPIVVTYIYTTTINGCSGSPENVTVTVNPIPQLSSPLNVSPICSGTPFNYTATSATGGALFTWNRATVPGISEPGTGNIGNVTGDVLTNTTTTPVNVIYSYTTVANGCSNTPENVTVTVNPTPVLNTTLNPTDICSATTFTYTASSATIGSTFTWNRGVIPGILEPANTGTTIVNEMLTNTTTSPVTVTYIYTSTANGCSSLGEAVSFDVNPIPSLNSTLTPADICGTNTFNYSPSSTTPGASFSWSRTTVAGIIETGTTGTNTVSEVLTNTTSSAIDVTYNYTTSANGCTNTSENVIVKVHPTPVLSSTPTPAAICGGTAFTYAATSATPATTFTWSRATVAGITEAGTTGAGNVNEILTNTTTAPINVTYVYAATANGCTNAGENVVVNIKPVPRLSSSSSPSDICGGTIFNYSPSSATIGASYTWSRASIIGIAEVGSTGSGIINETLTNISTSPIAVTYVITTTADGCSNSGESVVVNIKVTPTLSSSLTPPAICTGSVFNYTANSSTAGASYTWNRATIPGITPSGTPGTGNVLENLTNTTTSPIDVIYVYSASFNGCSNPGENVTVRVNPVDDASFAYGSTTYCQGDVDPLPSSIALPGGSFNANPGMTFISTTTGQIDLSANAIGTYTVTYNTAGPCPNSSTFIINITTTPITTYNYSSPSYCTGTVNQLPTFGAGATAGVFSASPTGLIFVSSATGEIDMTLSGAGIYTVSNTIMCGSTPIITNSIVTLLQTPTLSSSLIVDSICSNSTFVYAPTSATASTTFTWSRAAIAGITETGTTGTGNVNETLNNTTQTPIDVTYNFIATANGCTNSGEDITVKIMPVTIATPSSQTVCSGSSTNIVLSSPVVGATYSWTVVETDATGASAVTGSDTISQILMTTSPADGMVIYTVTPSKKGCAGVPITIPVTINSAVSTDAGNDTTMTYGEAITIGGSPTGDVSSVFLWSPSFYMNDETSPNPSVSPAVNTIYYVTTSYTDNGTICSGTDSVTITVLPPLYPDNGFSPNGDGVNDTWEIEFVENHPDVKVEIYNRWGELLFQSPAGYNVKWDGTFNGKTLPIGTYYYIIDLNNPDYPPYTGPVTIVR